MVKRLRREGAVILGTTNCPEFLMAYETANRLYGATANPWDLERSAGGSSGGEAAAITAGLSAGGLGSDGGGSVRVPAHFTGICSLKPTPGRIPASGHIPGSVGPFALLGTIGPMARTIADVDLLFRAVSGALDTDPLGAPVEYRPIASDALKQVLIGYFEDDSRTPVTPETRQAVRNAAKALQDYGFRVEPFLPPSFDAACRLWHDLFVRCGAMILEPSTQGREDELSPVFLDFLRIAHESSQPDARELLEIWCEIDVVRTRLLTEMQRCPILLSPVCAIPAFRHGEREWQIADDHGSGSRPLKYLDAMRFTQWSNLLGAPAAVLPAGLSIEGTPIGVQITGRPYAEELVLAISKTLEVALGPQGRPNL